MTSQTSGAVPGLAAAWTLHAAAAAAGPRWSVARQGVTGGASGRADQGRRAQPLPVGKGKSEDAEARSNVERPGETCGEDRRKRARLSDPSAPGVTSGRALSWVRPSSCATRLSLVRGAVGAAPCKAPVGGGVGGPRVVRGACAPPAGAAAPHPALPEPKAPRDFPRPPLRSVGLRGIEAAFRSAGRAAPDAADQARLSVGRGAVKALAPRARASKQSHPDSLAPRASGEALDLGSASLRALRVTAPRHGSVAKDRATGLRCVSASTVGDRPTARTA
jgi:hypothetical protein